jgi:ornithine--oxo-acid transaminase
LLADTGPDGMLERARRSGERLHHRLAELTGHGVIRMRGVGLWAGVDVEPARGTGREISEAMARRGVLVKDTHGSTIRLSPPLVIGESELDLAVNVLGEVLTES